jgi:hypothetical protein
MNRSLNALSQQPPVAGAVQRRPAREAQVLLAGPLGDPGRHAQQRRLEGRLTGGGELRARLDRSALLLGPEEPLAVAQEREPGVGNEDAVVVDDELRQRQRLGIPEGRESHHFALVAFAGREDRARQHVVEAAQADRARPVSVPQLLAHAFQLAAPAAAAVERGDLEEPRRRMMRARKGLGDVADARPLGIDDHRGRTRERRGVKSAVEMGQVVRDANGAPAVAKGQALLELFVVGVQVLDLGVRGVALDDEVDRLTQLTEAGHVQVLDVAEASPVMLAPGDALLLETRHVRRPARDRDRPVLCPVDPDNGGRVCHVRRSPRGRSRYGSVDERYLCTGRGRGQGWDARLPLDRRHLMSGFRSPDRGDARAEGPPDTTGAVEGAP